MRGVVGDCGRRGWAECLGDAITLFRNCMFAGIHYHAFGRTASTHARIRTHTYIHMHTIQTINGEAHNYWTSLLAYAYQAAATGAPVVTLPIGMIDHLPVGVQVMGKLWEDEELLAVARCLQDLLPPLPPPPIFAC